MSVDLDWLDDEDDPEVAPPVPAKDPAPVVKPRVESTVNSTEPVSVERIDIETAVVQAKDGISDALEAARRLVEGEGKAAVQRLQEVSKEAAALGESVLRDLGRVAKKRAQGKIGKESAAITARSYLRALGQLKRAAVNAGKVQGYERSVAAIHGVADVLLRAAEAAVGGLAPAAARHAMGWLQKALPQ